MKHVIENPRSILDMDDDMTHGHKINQQNIRKH